MQILSTFKLSKENIKKVNQYGGTVTMFENENALKECSREVLKSADGIIANHRTLQKEFMDQCKNLKWIHCPHIGIERLPLSYLQERGIVVTNGRGTAGVPISEDIMCMILMFARQSMKSFRNQNEHQWKSVPGVFNLFGKTLGIMGTGDVGSQTAKRAKAFGMRTIGMNTTGNPVEFFDEIYVTKDINEFLAQCDIIVCTLPPTEKTVGLVDREQFECMKPTAYLVNISRASIFHEEVLFEYLKDHKIAGAALDVFMDEFKMGYLPEDSPFWELDNLIVTPHMAGGGDLWGDFSTEIVMHNLQCFCENRLSDLLNIRDYSKGY